MEIRPAATFAVDGLRPHARIWTDAAGVSRIIAAVVCINGTWLWTRIVLPQSVWDSFLVRGDNQIGMQELLAIPLALSTFRNELSDAVATDMWTMRESLGAW